MTKIKLLNHQNVFAQEDTKSVFEEKLISEHSQTPSPSTPKTQRLPKEFRTRDRIVRTPPSSKKTLAIKPLRQPSTENLYMSIKSEDNNNKKNSAGFISSITGRLLGYCGIQ